MKYKVTLQVGTKETVEVIEASRVVFASPWVRFYRDEKPLRILLVKAFQEKYEDYYVRTIEEIENG